jgi:hypothetical protein
MFSSDLTDEELSSKIGHVSVPVLIAYSLSDEYVPSNIDMISTTKRLQIAMGRKPKDLQQKDKVITIEGANHGLSEASHQQIFIEEVIHFVGSLLTICK